MKIAIKANPSRGKEIISLLESLGGINSACLKGNSKDFFYYIKEDKTITCWCPSDDYRVYTLEAFEKEFPFKIGDKVKHITSVGTIKEYCYIDNEPAYKVKSIELDIIATIPVKILKPYKEMKEERNITLTLEKAKEWYKKGGELKEIALQAFSEKELNPLPRSWEEFCERYRIEKNESYINSEGKIISFVTTSKRSWNHICPSKKSAEAHLAMIQLEQLRNCWCGDWKPEWNNCEKYVIKWDNDDLIVFTARNIHAFLVFPTREMAEKFLECFKDLIEKAGDLI